MEEIDKKEFTFIGKKMETVSIFFSLFLIIWGFVVSYLSSATSLTSYIPSFLGLIIGVFAFLTIKFPTKKKLFMHVVALVGLIVMIGGLDFIRSLVTNMLFDNFWADLSKLMMLISGAFFVYLCFMSFRHARKNKEISSNL